MDSISPSLIQSLNKLGLTKYEARTYASLVLFESAEVKELVEYLSIAKPSVYEALDRLEEIGLAVKRTSRPAMYSPVSPEIAIQILLDSHTKAAKDAQKELKLLEKTKSESPRSDAMWTIYGDANIEYKIRDMFSHARKDIECVMGERYLGALDNLKFPNVELRLAILSENPDLGGNIRKRCHGKKQKILVISLEKIRKFAPCSEEDKKEIQKFIKSENMLSLIVDDRELLSVFPIDTPHVSALNTSNKGAILHSKMMDQHFLEAILSEEDPDTRTRHPN
ncbi:MAG: helix-turn-helix domain-containing protein [Methanoregulaceae archaeon]